MHNQPLNPIFHDDGAAPDALIDPPPVTRFVMLAIAFFAATFIVLGRMGWVQGRLQERYLDALNATTVEYEAIPARDGRILTESSVVLAADVDQYSVQMHYRWLQEPLDATWVSREVRRRLSRTERRDPALVEVTEADILSTRDEMWSAVAQVAAIPVTELKDRLRTVQGRVQRIADSVNRRRLQSTEDRIATNGDDGLLIRIASSIRAALTTPARRGQSDRIVVREEESFHEIVDDVPLEVAAVIRQQPHRFPGVRVVVGHRRTYPQGELSAHVVGARTPLMDEETADLKAATQSGSWVPRRGRFGVERTYEHQLKSVPGRRRIVRNRRMEVLEDEVEREPVGGRDVVLTLNSDLQRHAERLLDEALTDAPQQLLPVANSEESRPQPVPKGGTIVVMDAATGRLLVAASAPRFSLSLFTGSSTDDWAAANADRRHPFIHRVTSMALPPGSVIKPFTAAAAIEAKALDPDAMFACQGFLKSPDEHRCLIFRLYGSGHGDTTLTQALAQSCNVYFFDAAQRLGFSPLRAWFDRFGFGRTTGVDLPFEEAGNVPGSVVTEPANVRMDREALGLAIGQSSLTATPLQIVRSMAAIANGGWLVTPHVVSPDGTARTTRDIDDRPHDIARHRIPGLSGAVLDRIREGLAAVVQAPYGTGYKTVRLENVLIAGKSGTAETAPGKQDHAWFAGYFPADQPKYAFAVVLEHGGSGSQAAGVVARELVREMHRSGFCGESR
ncbi:peptidoglycan D,D-transpeptidase FtsI family protein [Fuerstiella marisgermanici]|uniref:beta-lactamase n=1 Tax=Fuerstiella marisgermanici TaxID=1891926 RepID=A0A1P8WNW7_9PLAN|nr:penicillin-binding transpeptidase domain-containing protein [Fuerstiella marisgermanici]APZ95753.1 Penicillin-binding protein B [Fuerstiella marisgermanici]